MNVKREALLKKISDTADITYMEGPDPMKEIDALSFWDRNIEGTGLSFFLAIDNETFTHKNWPKEYVMETGIKDDSGTVLHCVSSVARDREYIRACFNRMVKNLVNDTDKMLKNAEKIIASYS